HQPVPRELAERFHLAGESVPAAFGIGETELELPGRAAGARAAPRTRPRTLAGGLSHSLARAVALPRTGSMRLRPRRPSGPPTAWRRGLLLRAAPGGCPAVAGRLRRLATVLAHEQLLLGQAESPESGS
ncbi:hypothetical protein, partial [Actinacidiphila glaucinigra]